MPRTKISKTSKHLCEAATREEKIREFEASCDGYLTDIESKNKSNKKAVEESLSLLVQKTNPAVLKMTMGTFLKLNLRRFEDFQEHSDLTEANDVGDDITGNSLHGGNIAIALPTAALGAHSSMSSSQQQRGRTPEPLNSTRAGRPRRSRSVCDEYESTSSEVAEPNLSRSKRPTAMGRTKAISADRTPQMDGKPHNAEGCSPSTGFMRWPHPGEIVLSKYGSPIAGQTPSNTYVNLNIPMPDGVLILRPKKLGEGELKSDLIGSINPVTINQIKILQANLNLIMEKANQRSN